MSLDDLVAELAALPPSSPSPDQHRRLGFIGIGLSNSDRRAAIASASRQPSPEALWL